MFSRGCGDTVTRRWVLTKGGGGYMHVECKLGSVGHVEDCEIGKGMHHTVQ